MIWYGHLKTKALCEADFLKDRILIKGWLNFKNEQKNNYSAGRIPR